jgi:phage antirepressor YoqD-like protein
LSKAISNKSGNGKIIGKYTLLSYLRKKGVLTKTNLPKQDYINRKLFAVRINTYTNGQQYSQALVTPIGFQTIIHNLKKDNLL